MTRINWPYDWKRDRRTAVDLTPPPPPAIVGRGRGRPINDVAAAALEARRKLEHEDAAK